MNAASPFTGLGTLAYSYSAVDVEVPKFNGRTKVQMLRDLLMEHRRLTARQLVTMALEAELESTALVGGLLKNDIAHGRVKFDGVAYCWNENYDERLGESIADAIALLRRHGYRVEPPAGAAS
jgi:hypothetical protein